MPSLIVETSGLRRGGPITSRVLIGRLPTNGIVLADSSISRLHAWIDCDLEGLYYVADCGSLTGTRVNEKVVDKRQVLSDGDTIRVGKALITFREANDLPPATQPMNLAGHPPMENVEEAGVLFECVCGAPAWFKASAIGQTHKCRQCGRNVTIPDHPSTRAIAADEPISAAAQNVSPHLAEAGATHSASMSPGSEHALPESFEVADPVDDPHAIEPDPLGHVGSLDHGESLDNGETFNTQDPSEIMPDEKEPGDSFDSHSRLASNEQPASEAIESAHQHHSAVEEFGAASHEMDGENPADLIEAIHVELEAVDHPHTLRPATPDLNPEPSLYEPEIEPPAEVTERPSLFAKRRHLAAPHPVPADEIESPATPFDHGLPAEEHSPATHDSGNETPRDAFDGYPGEEVLNTSTALDESEHGHSLQTGEPSTAEFAGQEDTAHSALTHSCSVCHTAIEQGEATTTCPSCGLTFHAECWQENLGCSAYGCPQVGVMAAKDPAEGALTTTDDLKYPAVDLTEPQESFPWEFLFLAMNVVGTLLGLVVFGVPALVAALGTIVYRSRFHTPTGRRGIVLVAIIVGVIGAGVGVATSYYYWLGGTGGLGSGRLPGR